ncbi:MAG: zf-TFIIB domain-containing protein [Deltaproteobacteria bacterium]
MSESVKPSHTEDDYFAREDAEKKRKLAQKVHKDMAADEARRLRDLHHGHCPNCGQEMNEVKLRDVPVDVCFACHGIFLQHGDVEAFQHQINEGRRGVVAAILNWLKPENAPK